MRTTPGVSARIVFWGEFFDWVTGGDGYLSESRPWSHDRIHVTVDEERTREDDDVKKSACEVF